MVVCSAIAIMPFRLAKGSHLSALRRSIVVAAAGLAVWLAVLGSSSVSLRHSPPSVEIKAPAWTYRGSADGIGPGRESSVPDSSCDVD